MNPAESTSRRPLIPSGSQANQMVLLGTGTSVGVPVIGCDCRVCMSDNPRNQHMRCGVLVRTSQGNFVIDAPPELRLQLVRERVDNIHAAVFTHGHADHIMGLDDLRIFGHRLDISIPLFCDEPTERQLRQSFNYAFMKPDPTLHRFALPRVHFERIEADPFVVRGALLRPIRLDHGNRSILGFRINNVAYCTDVSHIPDESWPLLEGLDVLIIDALGPKAHKSHFCVGQALEVVERVRPRRAYLTHVSHYLEYEETNAQLPAGVEMAYD
ncbi:MAG: MBL fold metallo-hydrolase [Planctomycetota bacterium]|nr:MBL fold metallo-hydrolase [Planctomycetota bacterium]